MRIDSQAKFDWPLEPKNLLSALLRVQDFEEKDFPRILVPFSFKKMEKFYFDLTKELRADIFK